MADDRVLIVDGAQHHKWTKETFEDIRKGDISAVNITLAIWENARETLAEIGQWYRRFDQFSDLIMPVYTSDDIRAAYEAKKTGIIFGFQNTSPLEDNIEFVAVFAKLGVRVMQLTYNTQNLIGCGCYEPNDSGLTYFGADVIAEMNRHGVVIDLSHTGERTSMDAIEASTQPVAITHANPTWWKDVQRNKSDDMMRALAENGGVMGLGTYPNLFAPDGTLEQFCDMVARTVDFMGIDHVGIGSDHNTGFLPDEKRYWARGRWSREVPKFMSAKGFHSPKWPEIDWPEWCQKPSGIGLIPNGLRENGFNNEEVSKIMGGNYLRLIDQVSAAAN